MRKIATIAAGGLLALSVAAPASAKVKHHHRPSLMCQMAHQEQQQATIGLIDAISQGGDVQWAQLEVRWANRDARRYCR